MLRFWFGLVVFLAAPAWATGVDVKKIVETHIVPSFEILASEAAALAETTQRTCVPGDPVLETAFHEAFDAWIRVSHLRFGPTEQDERAFSLAFWPDPRSATPKALGALLRNQNPAAAEPSQFAEVSIAARGFYALEYLLYDPGFGPGERPDYHCKLVRAVAQDIALNAAAISDAWTGGYAALLSTPGNATYRTSEEAAKQVFTALTTGLEFTSQTRLGRPMGTFDKPRANRAEARRSGRSLRHVILSLEATEDLAAIISNQDPDLAHAYRVALERAAQLDDPVFSGVGEVQGRLRVEVLQQKIDLIRHHLAEEVGPSLGIAAGFNSLDGD